MRYSPVRPSSLFLLLLPVLCLALGGCGALGMAALHTANAASVIGNYQLEHDLAYGPEPAHRLDVYRPRRGFEGPRPVIVFFHGGDWSEQYPDKDMHKFVGEALASYGCVAVVANYRRYPSVRFPAFVEDAAGAVVWTRRHIREYGGDPEAIFLMGHSAGAHIASMVALNERYLLEAGGDPAWVRGLVGLAGPYSFLPMPDDPLLKALFGPPQRYPLSQPVNYVDHDAPPMLLLSGARDKRVPTLVMHRLERAVRAHGGEVETRTYRYLDHIMLIGSLAMPVRWSQPVIDDVTAFVHEQAKRDEPMRTVRAAERRSK
ncbi:MAG: alpha/beta hydrolase [Phycisphaeraceae bacterium]